jgi:hypothetical protein
VEGTLVRYREEVVERQLVQERIAWAAMEIFASACALSRWDHELTQKNRTNDATARFFLADSMRRAETAFRAIRANDDQLLRNSVT